MKGIIEINVFVKHLQDNNLVIVNKEDYIKKTRLDFLAYQQSLLSKDQVTILEVVNGELLPLKTKTGVRGWFKNGKIKQSDHHKKDGIELIEVPAIKDLRKTLGLDPQTKK